MNHFVRKSAGEQRGSAVLKKSKFRSVVSVNLLTSGLQYCIYLTDYLWEPYLTNLTCCNEFLGKILCVLSKNGTKLQEGMCLPYPLSYFVRIVIDSVQIGLLFEFAVTSVFLLLLTSSPSYFC